MKLRTATWAMWVILGAACVPTAPPGTAPPAATATTPAPTAAAVPPPPSHEWARGSVFYELGALDATRLDALQSLGVDGVAVSAADEEALRRFLDETRKRGLRVIVDVPFSAGVVAQAMRRLEQGADGIRVDATQSDTPESMDLLTELANEMKRSQPAAILVVKSTGDTATLAARFAALPAQMNVPLAAALAEGVKSSNGNVVRKIQNEMHELYPARAIDAQFFEGSPTRNAAAILLTLPGIVFLPAGDAPLDDVYREWIAVRKSSVALRTGAHVPVDTGIRAVSFVRVSISAGESALVVHNVRDTAVTLPLAVAAAALHRVHTDPGVTTPNTDVGTWQVTMPPRASGVWRIE